MIDKHPLLIDRIIIRAKADRVEIPNMTTEVLCDAYVEELTTAHADYAGEDDARDAFLNTHAIARELRRRDRDFAQEFIEEVHALVLDVFPDVDLSQLTCH